MQVNAPWFLIRGKAASSPTLISILALRLKEAPSLRSKPRAAGRDGIHISRQMIQKQAFPLFQQRIPFTLVLTERKTGLCAYRHGLTHLSHSSGDSCVKTESVTLWWEEVSRSTISAEAADSELINELLFGRLLDALSYSSPQIT